MRVCMCGCALERYQQNKSPEEIKIVLRGRQNWVEKEPEGGLGKQVAQYDDVHS